MTARRRIIVAGAPTAGKTTFAHELIKKFHVEHIQIDPIIEGFEDVFPQLGITHNAPTLQEHLVVCEKFRPFLFRAIDGFDGFDFVIEGFRMPLAELAARYGASHRIFVFGYPDSTPQERLARCREFDVENWTNVMSDSELMETFSFLIEMSKWLKERSLEYGVPFFDTSHDYWPVIRSAVDLVQETAI